MPHGPGFVQNISEQIQNGMYHVDAIVFDGRPSRSSQSLTILSR